MAQEPSEVCLLTVLGMGNLRSKVSGVGSSAGLRGEAVLGPRLFCACWRHSAFLGS